MNWADFPWGPALLYAGVLWGVLTVVLENHFRKKFVARNDVCDKDGNVRFPMKEEVAKDLNEMGKKIERNTGLFVAIDDRTGALETKFAQLEERQSQQWERISEQMAHTADTIKEVTGDLKKISEAQQQLAVEIARQRST